jgi:hypothetical protein
MFVRAMTHGCGDGFTSARNFYTIIKAISVCDKIVGHMAAMLIRFAIGGAQMTDFVARGIWRKFIFFIIKFHIAQIDCVHRLTSLLQPVAVSIEFCAATYNVNRAILKRSLIIITL